MRFTQLFDTNQKKFFWAVGIALILLAAFLVQEPTVGAGDTVVINYIISINGVIVETSLEDIAQRANIFDAERTYEPLVIIIGGTPEEGAVAPKAVERELLGMKVGDEKTIRLYPLEAYGYFDPDKVLPPMSLEEFIEETGYEPVKGESYQVGNTVFHVYEVTAEHVILDFNHRFAVNATEEVVSRAEFEQSAEARVGNVVMYKGEYAIVIAVTETEVVLDVNPAVFEFKVEIIQIREA
jgi:peptidylprolyl isomerase